jgi:protein-disulfide isomerase-like protein with CxxC motif
VLLAVGQDIRALEDSVVAAFGADRLFDATPADYLARASAYPEIRDYFSAVLDVNRAWEGFDGAAIPLLAQRADEAGLSDRARARVRENTEAEMQETLPRAREYRAWQRRWAEAAIEAHDLLVEHENEIDLMADGVHFRDPAVEERVETLALRMKEAEEAQRILEAQAAVPVDVPVGAPVD